MKSIFLALSSLVLLIAACGNTPQSVSENKQVDPPKPIPVDSTAKADSILNLKYNKAIWPNTKVELMRWDSRAAKQIDSCVVAIQGMSDKWGKKKNYVEALDTTTYKNIIAYAKKVEKKYDAFLNPPPPPVDDKPLYMVKKPVIYLYPEKEQNITVNLDFKGHDLYTWPKINNNNWNVTAKPDGMLTINGQQYPYLFWEGQQNDISYINQTEGFVIEGSAIETFLTEKLKVLGLNARERADFITYWAPQMVNNDYNFVRFETRAYANAIPLTITPTPESTQRILMVFKKVNEGFITSPQTLTPFTRSGYTAIEWGGVELPPIVN